MCDQRVQQKREEAQQDMIMCKQQQDLLDQQEKQRSMHIQNLQEQQKRMLARYEVYDARGIEMRRQRAEEERVQRHQMLVNEKEKKQQELRERRRQAELEERNVILRGQLEEQQRSRKLERDADVTYSKEFQRQVEAAMVTDQATEQQKRQKFKANADYLRGQMREKSMLDPDSISRDRMNEVERQINRDKLARAQDPLRPDGMCLLVKKKKNEYRNAIGAH